MIDNTLKKVPLTMHSTIYVLTKISSIPTSFITAVIFVSVSISTSLLSFHVSSFLHRSDQLHLNLSFHLSSDPLIDIFAVAIISLHSWLEPGTQNLLVAILRLQNMVSHVASHLIILDKMGRQILNWQLYI